MENKQVRNWCITINSPKLSDQELYGYLVQLPHVKYFVFSREKGDGTDETPTGTIHNHVYIEFSLGVRFTQIKKYFSEETIGVNAHVEPRESSRESCVLYVKKEGPFSDKVHTRIGEICEFGEFLVGGSKDDLNEILKELMDLKQQGVIDAELFEKYPKVYAHHYKMLDDLTRKNKQLESKRTRRSVEVVYIYGHLGTGKTGYVMDKYGDENVYRLTGYGDKGNPLYDDYTGEDVLLLDDFHGEITWRNLLNLLEPFPLQLPARYANRTANFTKVYILSDISIVNQYTSEFVSRYDEWCVFLGRIRGIYNFDESKESIVKEITFIRGSKKYLIYFDEEKERYFCEYLEEINEDPK